MLLKNTAVQGKCSRPTLPRIAVISVPAAVSEARTDSLHRALNTKNASFCKAASICIWALAESLEAWWVGGFLSALGAPGMLSAAEASCPANSQEILVSSRNMSNATFIKLHTAWGHETKSLLELNRLQCRRHGKRMQSMAAC